jgi:hypothetical protein
MVRSAKLWQNRTMIRLSIAGFLLCVLLVPPSAAQTGIAARKCLSTAETADAVRQNNLSSPALALRTAAAHARAEALRLVLCKWNGVFVYEITLLKREGKIIRLHVKADDGVLLTDMGLH